jgi:hypothetical protein
VDDVTLIEHLYVDVRRVNTYFQQISNPEKRETNASLSIGIALTGPQVSAGVNETRRQYTDQEKLSSVITFLQQSGQLLIGPPRDPTDVWKRGSGSGLYVTEVCNSTTVVIHSQSNTPQALTLWISRASDRQPAIDWPDTQPSASGMDARPVGALYLLEDLFGTDAPGVRIASAYSTLLIMGNEVSETGNSIREFATHGDTTAPDRFAQDPVGFLGRLGARIGATKRVRATYRVRNVFIESADARMETVTIGYPIVIDDQA